MKSLLGYWRDEEGVTTVEYALLLSLIVAVAISAWRTLGETVNDTVNDVVARFPSATS
jgi:Flp pilus assembly pilin Flp